MSVQEAFAAPQADVRDMSGGTGLMTDSIVNSLRKTRPWVMLMAVLGMIGAVFMVVAAIPMFLMGAGTMPELAGAGLGGMGIGMGIIYLVLAVIYFMASLYLLRYASAIKRAVSSLATADLEAALGQQASFWKLVGILTVISIVLMIGLMVAGISGAIMAM